tara:strand:- start:743 stop:1009 length:267 start_codon:yes stop_codon:yes gene_type:complete
MIKEQKALTQVAEYIEATYTKHYAKDKKFQVSEVIEDLGHGEGFYTGNIIKYASRLGKKKGASRKSDLQKLIHYAILLYGMDKTHKGD